MLSEREEVKLKVLMVLKPFDDISRRISQNHLSGHAADSDELLVRWEHIRRASDLYRHLKEKKK